MNRDQLKSFLEELEKVPGDYPVIAEQMALVLRAILADGKKQVGVQMTEEDMAVMDALVERTGCRNRSELVRTALKHYAESLEKSFQESQTTFDRDAVLDEFMSVVSLWLDNDEANADDLMIALDDLRKKQ